MKLSPALRDHIADLLDAVGPDAPTLCEGWTARDLAAHLVVRERRPDAMPGIVVPALAGHTKKVQDGRARRDYVQLVDEVRQGPGRFSPMSLPSVDERVNLVEFATHAEDVWRAQPDAVAAGLPELPEGVEAAIWKSITSMGKMLVRSSPVGVTARAAGFGQVVLKPSTGTANVTLVGSPVDLLMHLSGRRERSGVSVEGAPAAVAAFASTKLGL